MARHTPPRQRLEDVILGTRPVLYVPMQGNKTYEMVRDVAVTVGGSTVFGRPGPFAGASAALFDGAADYLQVATHASYHPGDTMSIGGWFNRTAAGHANGPVMYHLQGDMTVWFPPTTNAGRIVLRKAGTGDIFATSTTDWGSPYTKGWHRIAFTKTGATTKCYVDGVEDAGGGTVANQTFSSANTEPPTFGWLSVLTTTLDYAGMLAHWAIWDRVITAQEERTIYLAGVNQT
jgi:hypothetical protein